MEENYGKVMKKIDPTNNRKAEKQALRMEEDDVGLFSSGNYTIMGRKSRQQLTEDEKEARWQRRVMANRESARQTIRRRQAMLAELTQKTADLELVNKNLKRERELASTEYNLLKHTNEQLKAQIDDEMMKKEAILMMEEKEKENLGLQHAESYDSVSLTAPSVISNQSSNGPNWQSFPQALNGSIGILGSESGVAALMPMWMPNVEQMNSAVIAHPGAFVYVLPVPMLYPFPAPMNTTHFVQTSETNENLVYEFGSSCLQEAADVEPSLAMELKLQGACSCIFSGEEGGSIPSGDEESVVGFRNYVNPLPPNGEDIETAGKNEGLRIVPSNQRLIRDPIAAAAARKRRKELMKVKTTWT